MKKIRELTSEATLRDVIERWPDIMISAGRKDGVVEFWIGSDLFAVLDLASVIRKRAPLTGVQKEVMKIVRSPRKAKKAK